MNLDSSPKITLQRVESPDALSTLLQSFDELPSNPASLYLSVTSQILTIYVAPTRVVTIISLPYLTGALYRGDNSAIALKSFLETGTAPLVFFDARKPAKTLFDSCAIRLSNPERAERAHIHEVQMMEVALWRESDTDRKWLAGFDKCIARDSDLDINMVMPVDLGGSNWFDKRILHLPVLWKKYHDRLLPDRFGFTSSFWVPEIREATQMRLAVSCGETHYGYSVDSAESGWDKDLIDEKSDAWNENVMMDAFHGGKILGGSEHWEKYDVL